MFDDDDVLWSKSRGTEDRVGEEEAENRRELSVQVFDDGHCSAKSLVAPPPKPKDCKEEEARKGKTRKQEREGKKERKKD